MKYTIEGFSQEALIENGLDTRDAVFIRWFIDFISTGRMEYQDDEKGDRFYWLKHGTITEELPILGFPVGDTSIKRYLHNLVEKAVLHRIVKKLGAFRGTKTYYQLDKNLMYKLLSNDNKFTGDKDVPSTGDKDVPSTGDKDVPSDSSITDSSITDSSIINIIYPCEDKKSDEDSDFNTFYTSYPRKIGKTQAKKVYQRIKKKYPPKEILARLETYKKFIVDTGVEEKFIKYPGTFLNSIEDYEPAKEKKPKVNEPCPYCGSRVGTIDGFCMNCKMEIKGERAEKEIAEYLQKKMRGEL